jgi:predicted ATPase with chaperone activity
LAALFSRTALLRTANKFLGYSRCSYLDDPAQGCGRAPKCALDYQSKISGLHFDRIDLHVDVPAVKPADLSPPPPAESSADVAARVSKARAVQSSRYLILPRPATGQTASMRPPRTPMISSCKWTVVSE